MDAERLAVGRTVQLDATSACSDGSSVEITEAAARISSDDEAATVRAGQVTAVAPGRFAVSLSFRGRSWE